MIPAEKMRRLEIYDGEEWRAADLGQIEAGDRFRMFEPDGTPVAYSGDVTEFVCDDMVSVKLRQPA